MSEPEFKDPGYVLLELAHQHRLRAAELEREGFQAWLRWLTPQVQKIWEGGCAPRAAQFDKPPAAYE